MMKKIIYILILFVGLVVCAFADDYIDDLYFTPEMEVEKAVQEGDLQPKYNPNAKEIEWIIEETDSIQ